MTDREVPRIATRWTDHELLAAYAGAWRALIGTEPARETLAILFGQATLECARGGASCWAHNVGNIRGTGPGGAYVLLAGAYEFGDSGNLPADAIACTPPRGAAVPAGKVCYLLPSKSQRFRAYDSFEAGCLDKLTLLRARWPSAIEALSGAASSGVSTAAASFVAGLRGYFTGDATQYTRSVDSLARECLRVLPPNDWPLHDTDPAPAPDDVPTTPGTPSSKSTPRFNAVRPDDWQPQTSAATALPELVPVVPEDDGPDST